MKTLLLSQFDIRVSTALILLLFATSCTEIKEKRKNVILTQINTESYITDTETYSLHFQPKQVVLKTKSGKTTILMQFSDQAKMEKTRASTICYKNIAKGVDIVFYTKESGSIGYDLIVAPGINADDIRLPIDKQAYLSKDEKLILPFGENSIEYSKPYTYQEINGQQIEVDSRFALADHHLSFQIGEYDRTYPLIIDPEI